MMFRQRVGEYVRMFLVVALVLWAAGFSGAAQERSYMEQFSVDQGLPHTDVFATVQDGDGFIWIGTSKGLARFSESGGLRVVDDGIFATSHLALDDGRLLLTSYNGIFTYNPDNDGFEKIGPYEFRSVCRGGSGEFMSGR